MVDTGTYLYAVARSLDGRLLDAVTGMQGHPVRTIDDGELVAVVSTVGLDEFGEDGLRRNLENLRWLEATARGHDEVVRRAAAGTSALAPFRLATICRSDQGVLERVDELRTELDEALDRIEGRSEWSIKAYQRNLIETTGEATVSGTPPSAGSLATAARGTGVSYLERRRAQLSANARANARMTSQADRLYQAISSAADASRRLPSQDRRLTGRSETMTLNGAFLVQEARTKQFLHFVADLEPRYPTLCLEIDGPWPPYSFSTLDSP
ncbi:gas vesicle protein GvpL/GvpF [Kribbella amoyensis]|uniref:Gas vesicle protein GvpL/GvpF n=1 Tax=Kribbella amoyensis TaxID=996641 RepID=A0A561BSE3_9ACTN|nr:GvpL/GvpF family gas vesicle protein [Kribbella amoyensis]TWD81702.1 gas vesicle protein GvpL/GvpF [Kribbella amoyensis]